MTNKVIFSRVEIAIFILSALCFCSVTANAGNVKPVKKMIARDIEKSVATQVERTRLDQLRVPSNHIAEGANLERQASGQMLNRVESQGTTPRAIPAKEGASATKHPSPLGQMHRPPLIKIETPQGAQRAPNPNHTFSSFQIKQLLQMDTEHRILQPASSYVKFARIQALRAQGGEEITTVLADGTEETVNVANAGDFIVTNPGGEQYIVPGEKFTKKYEPDTELGTGWFKPAGGAQTFVKINHNMKIAAPWGEVQVLKKGAYLNVTDPDNIYGVAESEFHDTYKLAE